MGQGPAQIAGPTLKLLPGEPIMNLYVGKHEGGLVDFGGRLELSAPLILFHISLIKSLKLMSQSKRSSVIAIIGPRYAAITF